MNRHTLAVFVGVALGNTLLIAQLPQPKLTAGRWVLTRYITADFSELLVGHRD